MDSKLKFRTLDKHRILCACALLAVSLLLFETSSLDERVQDHFYNFASGEWLVDGREPIGRALFYTGPKMVVIFLGVCLFALTIGPSRWRAACSPSLSRRQLSVALLTIASVPALVGILKGSTNVFCPSESRRYGGNVPYVRVFERYPANDRPARRGRCFPAGHASGGFALIGLAALVRCARKRLLCVSAGMAAGWLMGTYQMAKGAHYLSHTVVTMFIAYILFLLWTLTVNPSWLKARITP